MLGYVIYDTDVEEGVVLYGFVKKASHGFTIGAPLYLSTTAGDMSNTAPTGTNDVVRVVGYAVDANTIFFNPDGTYITL